MAELLEGALEDCGFARQSGRWYQEVADGLLVFELLSATEPVIGLQPAMGVYYRRFGYVEWPKLRQCHVATRLETLVPDPAHQRRLMDPANDIIVARRRAELAALVANYALPWLQGLACLKTARAFLDRKTSAIVMISPLARRHLGESRGPALFP